MDDRQRQIREGAGLAESRLNEEFIEFLQKWSMPILVTVAVVAVGYTVYGKVQKARAEKVDLAFQEFETATAAANPSPDSLQRVAEEYEGVRSVPALARLAAADACLRTVRTGANPGVQLNPDGSLPRPEDALSDKDRDFNLTRAKDLYQHAYEIASRDAAHKITAINALYGLAAVAECRTELEGAKGYYEKIISMCENTAFSLHVKVARMRIDSLGELAKDIKLYRTGDLAPLPEAPKVDNVMPAGEAARDGGAVLGPGGIVIPPPPADAPRPEAPKPEAPKTEPEKAPSPAPTEPPKAPETAPPAKPGEPK